MIGVIGGMGPLATADFLQKVIEETDASEDQDHVPLLISCDPRIPRRPAAILQGAASPLPRLLEIRDRLLSAGVTALVMPCNTAHYWYEALCADCAVPFLSIVAASCEEAFRSSGVGATVAVVGTQATLAAGLFDRQLQGMGLRTLLPTEQELETFWLPAIAEVKSGHAESAGARTAAGLEALLDRGAIHVVLACTELPIALATTRHARSARCTDTNRALARATVRYWRTRQGT